MLREYDMTTGDLLCSTEPACAETNPTAEALAVAYQVDLRLLELNTETARVADGALPADLSSVCVHSFVARHSEN